MENQVNPTLTALVMERSVTKDDEWLDPTHGTIDRDIQEYAASIMKSGGRVNTNIAQRAAIEISLQEKRDEKIARQQLKEERFD